MPPRSALRRLASSNVSSPTALVAAPAEVFWQAGTDCEIFNAPMGAAIDIVPEGTVVKEHAQFIDPFNDRWIATADEDGRHVWLRELEELSLDGDEEERDLEWLLAVPDEAGHNVPAAAAPHGGSERRPSCAKPLGSDVPLFEYFWSSVHENAAPRDWNTQYQRLCEDLLFGDADGAQGVDAARQALKCLIEEFADLVESSVTAIVTDMFGASKSKTRNITKHPSAPGVYYSNGALLKIAIDSDGSLGGDEVAMKVSSHIYKNTQILSHIAPRFLISVPMTLSMTFGGYRVFASSIPPVRTEVSDLRVSEGSVVAEIVHGMAHELNLKPSISDGVVSLSPSFRVVVGLDCRLYALGLTDLMPPIAPPSKRTSYNPATTSRFWRIRPEAVEQSAVPLSAFAYSVLSSEGDDVDVLRATHWVRCVGLQTCAAVLGLMERCSVDGMDSIVCTGCGKPVEDELRFGVCASGCCMICAQCNINAYELMAVKEDPKGCANLLQTYVKCGSKANSIRSLRLSPDVTTILHHHGVNLRFLHAVYSLLPKSARGLMGHHLEIEMVARAAKCVFNRKLRRGTTSLQDIGTISAEFFMALMQPSGEVAEAFWAQELGPAIQELFDVFVPFDTEALDIVRVCDRVSELTGVTLTDESVSSFALLQTRADSSDQEGGEDQHVPTPPRRGKPAMVSESKPTDKQKANTSKSQPAPAITATVPDQLDGRAFIQISSISPTMKDFRVPTLASKIGDRRNYLNEHLPGLLLLWAGAMDGKKDAFMAFEASHPQYLNQRST